MLVYRAVFNIWDQLAGETGQSSSNGTMENKGTVCAFVHLKTFTEQIHPAVCWLHNVSTSDSLAKGEDYHATCECTANVSFAMSIEST